MWVYPEITEAKTLLHKVDKFNTSEVKIISDTDKFSVKIGFAEFPLNNYESINTP